MIKKISVFTILFMAICMVSCTSKKSASNNQFRALASAPVEMSEEEYNLNECFTNAKVACYELYPYDHVDKRWGESDEEFIDREYKVRRFFDSCIIDHSVSCSKLAGRDDLVNNLELSKQNLNNVNLVQTLDWFFLSPARINRFIQFVKNIREIKRKISSRAKKILKSTKSLTIKGLHGTGVGVTGSAFAAIGTSFTGEALVLDGNLSLYCAPGLMAITDVGVQASFSAVKALACKDRKAYRGKFLSLQAGVSAELLMLPVGVEAAYSFGMDTKTLMEELVYYKSKHQLNLANLIPEFIVLETVLPLELAKSTFTSAQKTSLWFALMLGKKMSADKDGESAAAKKQVRKLNKDLGSIVKNKGSFSYLIKSVIKSQKFQNVLTKYKLRNLKNFFKALGKSLTGCDSISGGVSVGLTLSPINVGVMLTHYEEIFNTNLEKIISLKNLKAFALMNPFLIDTELLRTVVDLARLVENFPGVVKKRCYGPAYQRLKDNFYLLEELASK